MAITLVDTKTASYFKKVTVLKGDTLKVLIDDVEDADFRVTAPADVDAEVNVTIQVIARS